MELTLKDRVLILNTVLPQFDTRKNMELKVSIDSKIAISEVDQKRIVIKDMGSGQINIGFTDAAAITETTDIALTDEELQYLKQRVDFIDRNGMFSEFTMPTYVKILDEPLKEENNIKIRLPSITDRRRRNNKHCLMAMKKLVTKMIK